MERYESKQVQILRPASMIYMVLSRFDNLTPVVGDKVDNWEATEDNCSFKVKGFSLKLRMEERVEPKLVKVVSEEGSPISFSFWIQLVEATPADTRMRIVVDVELNTMMKMMIGGKIQDAVDKMAQQIAMSFNNAPI